jgi:hypothetical protein
LTAANGGKTFFVAVVGYINATGFKIKGVTVKGGLNLGPQAYANHLCIGGFIGSVEGNGGVTFENCVSDMQLTIDSNYDRSAITTACTAAVCCAGFIGGVWGVSTASFTNCYSTGAMDAKIAEPSNFWSGGFVGGAGNANGGAITITNCYSSLEVDAYRYTISDSANAKPNDVGGFIGYTSMISVTITNTLALNPHVRATNGAITAGRIIGRNAGGGTGTVSLNGLYALDTMELKVNGSPVALTADTTVGQDGESTADGTGTGELRNKAFWTGLGFTEADWDFSGLAAGWPVLR